MKPAEKDLVRVESADELHPGMTVWLNPCNACGRRGADVLLRPHAHAPLCQFTICPRITQWQVVEHCPPFEGFSDHVCYAGAIAEGRLFRLRELPASDESTTEKRREVVA